MISKCIIFWLFIILFSNYYVNADNTLCVNWQTYKDEKCIKIIDEEKLVSFEDALKSCPQIDNKSQILTIHSKEEQDFISEYLFKTHKLVENVWIGLKNSSKDFEWTDSSNKAYTNWKTGNPTNKPDYNCVQLDYESFQWINSPCIKKGLIVCQKLPEITLSDLLKQFLETKEDLKQTKEILNKSVEDLNKTKEGLKKSDEDLKETKEDLRVTKEGFKKSDEDLKQTKEILKKSVEDLKETKDDLKQTKEQLKETRNEKNEIFNVVFNSKVSHYQLFTDINGNNKAFIIPLSAMRKNYTFDESVNLCKYFNSTLIEIQSLEKQIILESFLGRLGFESNQFLWFWVNGLRDTSGKWKWIESNTQFNYTNWQTDHPNTFSDYNNIYVQTHSTDTFGKWYNTRISDHTYVMCEHTFGF